MAKISVDQVILKAKSHAKKGEIEDAKKLYQSVLQAFPKNVRAQQGLAALSKPKQNDAAQAVPQEIIDRLLALYNRGQLTAVVEQAQALTEQYPEAFFVWNILSVAAAQIGKYDQAVSAFRRVIVLKPDYADAYNNMGNALKAQDKRDEAIAAYNKALLIKPDYADAYYNMGNALKEQGKLDDAIAAFNKALSIKPDYAQAHNNIGVAFQEQDKLEEAIEAYDNALTTNPNYADAYGNTLKLLKIYSPKIQKNHILFRIDESVKKFSHKLKSTSSDKEIANNLSEVLDCISKDEFNFKTPLSQVYKHNSIDLNCNRHTKIFNTKNIIPEFCFGCFKVQVEMHDLFSLIKLTMLFYELELEDDLTRKTMIELRPDIPGFYKGLIYCRGLQQAQSVKKILDNNLNDVFKGEALSIIKRGCSEFPLSFPEYGDISADPAIAMDYPGAWKSIEDQFDHNDITKPMKNITPSISEFSLGDFYIIKKWIDYAKGLKDPSSAIFYDKPIVFPEIYDAAVWRKSSFNKKFE